LTAAASGVGAMKALTIGHSREKTAGSLALRKTDLVVPESTGAGRYTFVIQKESWGYLVSTTAQSHIETNLMPTLETAYFTYTA